MSDQKRNINHILLADDDEDDKIIFSEVMKKISPATQISYVSDGNEVLDFLQGSVPDLVFLDLNMPLKGGLESLSDIREDPAFKVLPIIIYSTSSNRQYIEECYNKGADCYIVKPYTFDNITKVLTMILDKDWNRERLPAKDEFVFKLPY